VDWTGLDSLISPVVCLLVMLAVWGFEKAFPNRWVQQLAGRAGGGAPWLVGSCNRRPRAGLAGSTPCSACGVPDPGPSCGPPGSVACAATVTPRVLVAAPRAGTCCSSCPSPGGPPSRCTRCPRTTPSTPRRAFAGWCAARTARKPQPAR